MGFEYEDGARGGSAIKQNPPDAVVIYLTRLPSHGRATAEYLTQTKSTRSIPLIFVGGEGEALEKTRTKIPGGIFIQQDQLQETLGKYSKPLTREVIRCTWAGSDELYYKYHDEEWGVPLHDNRRLFEMLILEGAQAGLSWITVLRKRDAYRKAFDNFDPQKIARYNQNKIDELLTNPGIIRNRAKILATIDNAKAYIEIPAEFGSFEKYVWQFVGGKPITNKWKRLQQLPAETKESQAMSKDLKKRGFRFVGPTICYAFMQATGMVNDHLVDCFRYKEVQRLK
ncbi:MAG TPA: DNA-3-methyladenine glycosylase I [Candidatus Binatia bacterium]|nr:DNA-3-methyladenine glycosylase I [Candidatus Binatia bacterium]